ncbi:serine/threonine-protein kinase [Actinomadura montaniterrae]|uniref:non-specific serine/threonine protein kinase n=1 Tax=Actinomadura montaniterrae TaxID=1803903 RepID=A0A6L3VZL4_9ACTN|nr:serine/threonine-protein kinase [Actinomadura montaniterrae]KAB2381631.1 protein kinase [Actinomadura montaniterrae]
MQGGLELAGRYRLEEPLGRGGMGEVWRGVDLRLRRPVAVKILPLAMAADPASVARFRREAEIAATLNHPGITTVFDIDEHQYGDERLLFLVMELMQGRDLQRTLGEHPGGMPIERVKDLAVQILDAMSAAHGRGIVHRDLKPANLFLLESGRVKVCDFGIARLADATKITATGGSAGTPMYMAAEQIQGRTVDQRTDLYAFGCVLYEMLTGAPWVDTGAGLAAILYQHLEQIPAPPRSLRADVPEHLNALVLELLAKRPDDRPHDATAVIARLNGAGAETLPQAPSPETVPTSPSPVPETLPATPAPGPGTPSYTRIAAVTLAILAVCGLGLYALTRFGSGTRQNNGSSDETPSGTTLKLGDLAFVLHQTGTTSPVDRIAVGVNAIDKLPITDFEPTDRRKIQVPYCIRFSLTNRGDRTMSVGDVNDVTNHLSGILPDGAVAKNWASTTLAGYPNACPRPANSLAPRTSQLETELVFSNSTVVAARWQTFSGTADQPKEYTISWK